MDKLSVFGMQHVDFSDKSGRQVQGISLHCMCSAPNQYWKGLGYTKLWFPLNSDLYQQVASLPVPCELQVDFNRFGKPSSLDVLKK